MISQSKLRQFSYLSWMYLTDDRGCKLIKMCFKIFSVAMSSKDSTVKLTLAFHRRQAPTSFSESYEKWKCLCYLSMSEYTINMEKGKCLNKFETKLVRERHSRSGDNAKWRFSRSLETKTTWQKTSERLSEKKVTSGRRRRRKITWCLSSFPTGADRWTLSVATGDYVTGRSVRYENQA